MSKTVGITRKSLSEDFGCELYLSHGRVHVSRISGYFQRNGKIQVGDHLIQLQGKDVRDYRGGLREIRSVFQKEISIMATFLHTDPEASSESESSEDSGDVESSTGQYQPNNLGTPLPSGGGAPQYSQDEDDDSDDSESEYDDDEEDSGEDVDSEQATSDASPESDKEDPEIGLMNKDNDPEKENDPTNWKCRIFWLIVLVTIMAILDIVLLTLLLTDKE